MKKKKTKIERKDTVKIYQKDYHGNVKQVFESKISLSEYLNIPYHILNRKLKNNSFKFNGYNYEVCKKI